MKPHTCKRPTTCCCSIQGLEPDDDCPIHSGGEWPPRCETCGRLMPWPKLEPVEPRCVICGGPAPKDYGDEELPSCGKPACELQMQAAIDYHQEAGSR